MCVRGPRGGSFCFDVSLFYHAMKGQRGSMFKKHRL